MPRELSKSYNPGEIEAPLYKEWCEKGYFTPSPDKNKQHFTIVIPPPNVTGQLHMGHALDESMQDTIIRYKRMQGFCTLWVPGTDHAGIATQIKDESKSKDDLKVAFNLYEKACSLEDNLACVNLGLMYVYGDGTKKDLNKGHHHISWACGRNNALACNLEAFFYKDGLSVRKDRNKALKDNCTS